MTKNNSKPATTLPILEMNINSKTRDSRSKDLVTLTLENLHSVHERGYSSAEVKTIFSNKLYQWYEKGSLSIPESIKL